MARPTLLGLGAAAALACGSQVVVHRGAGGEDAGEPEPVSGTGGSPTGTGGSGGAPTTSSSSSVGSGGRCEDEVVPTASIYEPLDVVLVVENGFNMADTIQALEANLYVNFAQILDDLGIDHQIVALTDHGIDNQSLCVAPPISGTLDCNAPPVEVPGQFHAYDVPVPTSAPLCVILDTLHGAAGGGTPDQAGLHPDGWLPLLRPEANHALLAFTSSGVGCFFDGQSYWDQGQVAAGQTVAIDWDAALLASAPGTFGNVSDRRYVVHSVIGLAEKSPNPAVPYGPGEPVTPVACTGAFDPGTGYQWLSRGTGGFRYPICPVATAGAILADLAANVAESVRDPCVLDLLVEPDASLEFLSVVYTAEGGGPPQEWHQVFSEACTADDEFYVDEQALTLHLCPATCEVIETAPGDLDVSLECPPVSDFALAPRPPIR